VFPDALSRYKELFDNSMEFDVFIPNHKIAIEYDGAYWHQTDDEHKREVKKYNFCRQNGITLYRIKEQNKHLWNDVADKIYYVKKVKSGHYLELETAIDSVIKEIDSALIPDIDIKRDKNEILKYLSKLDKSLADLRPDVAAKWNYERNGNLTPDMFTVGSYERVWWKCPDCGHEWQCNISGMTREGRFGCAICSKKRRGKTFTKGVVARVGSMAETMPELAKEWHPDKNGDLTPYDITSGRFKPVWWLCPKCNHEWRASPNLRKHGIGCPCCSGRVANVGVNDLETLFPNVALQWDYEKNGNLKPNQFLPGSGKKVWWKCEHCGAEWQRDIWSQVHINHCPHCSKNKNQLELDFIKNRGKADPN
jgi:hypothetical protein